MPLRIRLFVWLLIGFATIGMSFAGDRSAKKKKTPKPNIIWGLQADVEGMLAYERARAYPLPARDVLNVFEALAKERKMNFSQRDHNRGIFVSKWIPIDEKRFPKLDSPDEIIPVHVRYHVFIPQGIEPARAYINSELETRYRNGHPSSCPTPPIRLLLLLWRTQRPASPRTCDGQASFTTRSAQD